MDESLIMYVTESDPPMRCLSNNTWYYIAVNKHITLLNQMSLKSELYLQTQKIVLI